VDIGAYGTHNTSSFVAENCWWVGETGEQVCLPDEFLVGFISMACDGVEARALCTHCVADAGVLHLDQEFVFAHFIEDDGG
jgi:hypothetical protein